MRKFLTILLSMLLLGLTLGCYAMQTDSSLSAATDQTGNPEGQDPDSNAPAPSPDLTTPTPTPTPVGPTPTPTPQPTATPTPTPVGPTPTPIISTYCDYVINAGESINKYSSTAQPGQTVCVRPGTYAGTLTPQNAGNASQGVITFKAEPPCVKNANYLIPPSCSVKIPAGVYVNRKQFVRIEGFEIEGADIGEAAGIYCQDRGESLIDNVQLVNNYIHHSGNGIVCRNARNSQITDNYITDLGTEAPGAGIGIRGDQLATHVTIGRNVILRVGCDGMDLSGHFITIENNILGDSWSGGCHQDGLEIYEPISNFIIRNNIIYDFTQLIYPAPNSGSSDPIENVEIYGNILYNNKYWTGKGGETPGIFMGPGVNSQWIRNISIHSNTFGWLGYPAIRIYAYNAALSNINIRNNIFYGSGIDIDGNLHPLTAADIAAVSSDYNLFYTDGNAPNGRGEAQPWINEGSHSMIGQNPQFVNYDFYNNFDFRLRLSSPAIDKGDPNLDALFSLPNPFVDIDGSIRASGLDYDIGAYEHPGP